MDCHEIIKGVYVFEPRVFSDSRGSFSETYHQEKYAELGLKESFVQDNLVRSSARVLRGLHYQNPNAQGKLVSVFEGTIHDVAVDLRPDEPTFGCHIAIVLSSENRKQVYIPKGFAHGYYVLSDSALVHYKCTDSYSPAAERGVCWNDPDLGIIWPDTEPIVNERDLMWEALKTRLSAEELSRWGGTLYAELS